MNFTGFQLVVYNLAVCQCMLGLAPRYLVGCVAQLAERRPVAGELTLSCARPAADG